VAVSWQIYAFTHSTLQLGIAALVQVAPSGLLMLRQDTQPISFAGIASY
jgi:hypothetical protein